MFARRKRHLSGSGESSEGRLFTTNIVTRTDYTEVGTSVIEQPRPRQALCLWQSESDSCSNTDSAVSSDQPKRKCLRKKKGLNAHDFQYGTSASEITQEKINRCLNIEYECPSNISSGQELDGCTKNDIVQDLLHNFEQFGVKFPTYSVNEFLKTTTKSVPNKHRCEVEEFFSPLIDMIGELDFRCDNLEQMIDSYTRLGTILKKHVSKFGDVGNLGKRMMLQALKQFVDCSLSQDLESHAHLTSFFKILMETFTHIDEDRGVSHVVSTNRTGKPLPLTIGHVANKKAVVITKPDLLFEEVTHINDDDESEPSSTCISTPPMLVFRAFCMELKTTNIGLSPGDTTAMDQTSSLGCSEQLLFASDVSKKETSSECSKMFMRSSSASGNPKSKNTSFAFKERKCENIDDWKPWISNKNSSQSEIYAPFAPNLDKLRTQHFIELLAMIKSQPNDSQGVVRQVHAFGFYVVMHRVYVTALQVSGPRHLDHYDGKLLYVRNENDKMRYRMVCCNYFNIFKKEHFKAFMEFIFYLVFKQHNDYRSF